MIALVSHWSRAEDWLRHEGAKHLIAGATECAQQLSYALQHFWACEGRMAPARFGKMLVAL